MSSASLAEILALARAGASERAWRLLTARDLQAGSDPATLNLMARLLKDRARRASGEEQRRCYGEAAAAYRRSAELRPATYPLINAASVTFLAGDDEAAHALAARVLALIEGQPDEAETPYWSAATRAEALLLLGRHADARAALAQAIALAPRAWEDHASTLRQFRLILAAQKADESWLDARRPPRSLHFGGHMSFDASTTHRELEARIAEWLDREDVGFGFGALAAGADIIIAEALLSRGAELHAVLPGGVQRFAAASVDPCGSEWRRRFDLVLDQAASVRPVRPMAAPVDAAVIALADEVAMGAAAMNALRLESDSVQLLVLPEDEASASDRSAARWAAAERRQRLILAARESPASPLPAERPAEGERRTLAILAVDPAPDQERTLAAIRSRLDILPAPQVAPYWSEGRLILAYADIGAAARTAAALVFGPDPGPLRVGGHYALAASFTEPFSGGERIALDATGPATAAMDSTPAGTACVTEDFAAALAAAGPRNPATEDVGELDAPDGGPPIGLHALRSYDQLFQPMGSDDAQ